MIEVMMDFYCEGHRKPGKHFTRFLLIM